MMVHFDNASPHAAKRKIDYMRVNRLMLASHSVFSPDLVPSEFYLFGKPKMASMGAAFADDKLWQGVMEVLNGISREEPEAVLRNGV
jgi:hypothetical protein